MYDIIVFAHLYKPHIGGLEKYVENFYKNQPKKKVIVITSWHDKKTLSREVDHNIEIQRIDVWEMVKGKYYIPSFKGLKQIVSILRENKSSEVHTHTRFYFTNFIATLLSQKYHQKHYHFEHGASFVKDDTVIVRMIAWIFDHTLSGYILRHSKKVLPVSDGVRAFLQKHFSHLNLGATIYNSYPFVWESFKQKSQPKNLKLLSVGRIIRSKGIYEIVDACTLLKESNISFTLTMIGDGSEMGNLKRLIKDNGLERYITLKGLLPFEETQAEFQKYDIFLNPSYTEGLPTTVLEGLANSLFVVATDVGGTREIIPQDRLIDLKNLSGRSIKNNIVRIMENWKNEVEAYRDIYKTAKIKFNWKENIKKYEQIS